VRIVSAAKHAALRARYERTARDLEAVEKLAAERQATIARQADEIARLRDAKPDSPVQNPRTEVGDAELLRRLNLANRTIRELDERVGQLQDSHIADTRELHDLRQGVTQ
jgi:hypothetical protein